MSASPRVRTIVLPEAGRPKPAPRPAPVPVVVEMHSDGFVVVFGEPHVRVTVVQRLDDEEHPALATEVDGYTAMTLPPSHRAVYDGRCVRATGLLRRRTVESELDRLHSLELVESIRAAGDELRRGHIPRGSRRITR